MDDQEAPLEHPQAAASKRSFWGGLEHYFTLIISSFAALLLLSIVLIIGWQVAARYLPGLRAPRWTSEVSLLLMVWLAMLGSGLGVRAGEHLATDIAVRQLPEKLRQLVLRFVWLLTALFGAYLVWYGYELSMRTMRQTFSATGLPIGWMYLGLPLGGCLIALYALRNAFAKPEIAIAEDKPVRSYLVRAALLVVCVIVVGGAITIFGMDRIFGPVGLLLGSFAMMLSLGVPIAVAIGIASLVTASYEGFPLLIVAQRMANGVNSIPLLAIPFFILAGHIIAVGGIAQRLVDFARVLVGPVRGGLAMVNIVASMLFGGASGSAVADVSANGAILIPMMKKNGYDTDFSVGITVASSTQGLIIPPSHNTVIYSLAAGGVSIGALFLGGYIPGIMIGVALMIASYILATRRGYPSGTRPPLRESLLITLKALPALAVGVIIVGGIAFGFFTATEAAAIGTVAAFLVAALVYRELPPAKLWQATQQSVRTISIVIFLIATASAFAWMMATLRIPSHLASGILSLTGNPILLLLLINVLLLMLGAIMDMAPLIIILTPVLLPIVTAPPIDMSAVHFGIVLLMNLGLGLTTPPVGTALFVGCAIGNIRIERASRAMLYLWPAMLVVLLLVTYFPWFVTALPDFLGSIR